MKPLKPHARLATVAVALFITASCRIGASAAPKPEQETAEEEIITLTVSFYDEISVDTKVASFESMNPGVKIEAENHLNDFEKFAEQLQTRLMANDAYDMFDVAGLNYYAYADKGLLTDIYEYLYKDKIFKPDKHFMNVLEGMEYKGGLYAYPKSFSVDFVSVNRNAPPEIIEAFKQLEAVDYKTLIDLYDAYAADTGLWLEPEFTVKAAIYQSLGDYVDYGGKTCDFNNPGFVRALKEYRQAVLPGSEGTVPVMGSERRQESDEALSKRYLFLKVQYNEYNYFFDYGANIFTDAIPLASASGEIIVNPRNNYAIYQGCENKEAAWQFARYLSTRSVASKEMRYYPLNREAFERNIYWRIRDIVMYNQIYDSTGQHSVEGNLFKSADVIYDRLYSICGRPARPKLPAFDGTDIIMQELDLYLSDFITAEQAAINIQTKMSIKLAE